MKKCTTCQHEIDDKANKCTECDAYQDFRRYLSVGNTVLALFVALIGILTAVIPIWKSWFWKPNIDLFANIAETKTNGEITLIVSNVGNVPFAVKSILVGTDNEVLTISIPDEARDKRLIQPNGAAIFRSLIRIRDPLPYRECDIEAVAKMFSKTSRSQVGCEFQINVVSTKGISKPFTIDTKRSFDDPAGLCSPVLTEIINHTVRAIAGGEDGRASLCRASSRISPEKPTSEMCRPFIDDATSTLDCFDQGLLLERALRVN